MSSYEHVGSTEQLVKKTHVIIGLIVTTIIGFLDYWTGFEFRMKIFYPEPISYVSWYIGSGAERSRP